MNTRTVIRYVLAALAVVILGALTGWYFFLRSQTNATVALGNARGFGSQTPVGAPFGTADAGLGASGSAGASAGGNAQPPQLWQVATTPAGGIGFATTTRGTALRYAERATGYIFDADPRTAGIERLTNSLMPKTYEASFASGDRVIERSLDAGESITTFAGTLRAASSSSPLTGTSLPKNLIAVAANPKTPQVLYLQKRGSGSAGVISGWDGSKPKQFFSSPLSDWRVWWLADGRVILAQKAADSLSGYAYTVQDGELRGLLGPLPGLVILPRANSSALLYSTSSGDGLALFAQTSATTSPARLPIATSAEKCVWAPGSTLIAYCAVPQTAPAADFLDSWYRGETHSSDAIWRVDASSGRAQLVFTPASDVQLDVIDPAVDDSGAYLAFMNNIDETPWLLRLNK